MRIWGGKARVDVDYRATCSERPDRVEVRWATSLDATSRWLPSALTRADACPEGCWEADPSTGTDRSIAASDNISLQNCRVNLAKRRQVRPPV